MLGKVFAWNAGLKLLIKNAQIVILKTNNFKETAIAKEIRMVTRKKTISKKAKTKKSLNNLQKYG